MGDDDERRRWTTAAIELRAVAVQLLGLADFLDPPEVPPVRRLVSLVCDLCGAGYDHPSWRAGRPCGVSGCVGRLRQRRRGRRLERADLVRTSDGRECPVTVAELALGEALADLALDDGEGVADA